MPTISDEQHSSNLDSRHCRAQRWLILVGIALIGLPQSVAKYSWGLPVPIQNAGALLVILVAIYTQYRSLTRRVLPLRAWILMCAIIYSMVNGALRHDDPRFLAYFYVRECLFLAMCFAGVLIAKNWPAAVLWIFLEHLIIVLSLLLIGSTGLLRLGLIGDGGGEVFGRWIDISLYVYSGVLLLALPAFARNSSAGFKRVMAVGLLAILSLLFFGIMSATRSVFLQLAVSACISAIFLSKRFDLSIGRVLGAGALALIVCGTFFYVSDSSVISDRLKSTDIQSEIRYVELMEFLSTAHEWLPAGVGIGIGFQTAVTEGSSDSRFMGMVNAPHIGIITWSVKAGILGFLLTIIIIVRAWGSLFEPSDVQNRIASLDGPLVVFLCIASTSGGWTLMELFFLGLCLGWAPLVRVSNEETRRALSNRFRARSVRILN